MARIEFPFLDKRTRACGERRHSNPRLAAKNRCWHWMSSSVLGWAVAKGGARGESQRVSLFFRWVTQLTSRAQPPHSAERLRLSVALFFYLRLCLIWRHSLQLIQGPNGKAKPYRTVRRQSRGDGLIDATFSLVFDSGPAPHCLVSDC